MVRGRSVLQTQRLSAIVHAVAAVKSSVSHNLTCFVQEHRQEVTQRDVRAYTRSTSKSAATEENKSAVTDHAISLNHVIDWDRAKVIDRESNRMDRWIREARIYIRKEQDKSMKPDERSLPTFTHL